VDRTLAATNRMNTVNPNRPAKRARTIRRAVARSAFSLIEMVACIAIIATLSAIAIPRYGAAVGRYRVEAGATRIVSEIHRNRDRSRRGGRSITMTFVPGRNTFTTKYTLGTPEESKVRLSTEPYWSVINSAAFGADAAVVFNGYGTPDSGGTVVVRHGRIASTITIDTAGTATFSRPAPLTLAQIVVEIPETIEELNRLSDAALELR